MVYIPGKLLFIHIPKTGGKSVIRVLTKQGGILSIINGKFLPPYSTVIEAQNSLAGEFNRLFSFCFVRNPWDWFVSKYEYVIQSKAHNLKDYFIELGFKRYIQTHEGGPSQQMKFFCKNGEPQVTYVGRFESLGTELLHVLNLNGLDANIKIPHIGATKRRPYKEYYDEETKQIIEKVERDIINRFGYKFE